MLIAGPRRLLRRLAPALAVAGAISVPVAAAGPASADQPRQRQQWVLAALNVTAAWRITQGRGVTVAVIDSGVDPTVSDLTGSVTTGPDYTGVHTPQSNPNWGAHGTWMASLIAGHGHGKGNGDGVLGVAPLAHILSIRVITDQSDPGWHKYHMEPAWRAQRQLARAIRYAVDKHVQVISMSLGYSGASIAVRAALQFALDHNVVVVASSGNAQTSQTAKNSGAPYSFPADYPGVIGVAAVSQSGQAASFSSENLSVQVAAPGVNVPAQGRGSKYWLVSGTSPACALTAGVAALIRSKYRRLTAAQVRSAITLSTSHRPKTGYDDRVGFGTVDAVAALAEAGRLAKQVPAGNTPAGKAAASGHFGRGLAGVPAFPVAPRSREKLFVLLGISAACLLLVIAALWRLIAGRGRRRPAPASGPTGPPLPGGAGGSGGGAGAGPYPTQIYPAQPYRQGRPDLGYLGQPAGYPGAGYPGAPAQAGQLPASATTPGSGYPGQLWPAAGDVRQEARGEGQSPPGYASPLGPGPGRVPPAPFGGSVPPWQPADFPGQAPVAPSYPPGGPADQVMPAGPGWPGGFPPGPAMQGGTAPPPGFPAGAMPGSVPPPPGFPAGAWPGGATPSPPYGPPGPSVSASQPAASQPPVSQPSVSQPSVSQASVSQPAVGQPAAHGDDDWRLDHHGGSSAQPGRTQPPATDAGRLSPSLSDRLEAAARAREQAQAEAARDVARPEAEVAPEDPLSPGWIPPAEAPPGAPADAALGSPAQDQASGSWAFDRSGDWPGSAGVTLPRRRPGGAPHGRPGEDSQPAGGGSAADVTQRVFRSAWEPPAYAAAAPADAATGAQPSGPAGSPPAPLGSSAPTWQPGLSRQPATIRRMEPGEPPPSSPAAEQAVDPAGPTLPLGYVPSTGISRQPGTDSSRQAPDSAPAFSPRQAPEAGSASSPPAGPAPLPRRQPQTHLAAQLRRPRPHGAGLQEPEPSPSLPSVWDARPAAGAPDQASSPAAREHGDDQA